jgi:hypothetical protein
MPPTKRAAPRKRTASIPDEQTIVTRPNRDTRRGNGSRVPARLAAAEPFVVIVAEPKPKLLIDLVGVDYEITPPKAALAMAMAMNAKNAGEDPYALLDAISNWIRKAFGAEQAAAVLARMEDEDDLLDLPHIMQLMTAMIEKSTGDPTT